MSLKLGQCLKFSAIIISYDEEFYLLGYTVHSVQSHSTFWRNISPTS
jgi:hypothetical protein